MLPYIFRYGVFAGLIVGIPMAWYMISLPADTKSPPSMVATYLVMLVALSMVFVGIQRYRDQVRGGVINFAPALGLGLAISGVAGIFYAVSWEIAQVFMKFDFADFYAKAMVENARSAGATPDAVAAASQRASDFMALYSNPLFRIPMTFLEIFPVGVLVSLISAAVLRKSSMLPARQA